MRHPLAQLRHSLAGMQRVLPAPGLRGPAAALGASTRCDTLYRQLAHGEQAVQRGLQVISMTLDEVSARPLDAASFRLPVGRRSGAQGGGGVRLRQRRGARHGARVSVQEDFQFRGDETAYLFVLFNLIKNALVLPAAVPGHPA